MASPPEAAQAHVFAASDNPGHAGLDLRWTPAKRRMWSARFGALGVRKRTVRVLVEEGALRGTGEDEWEEHLSAALGNHSVRWLQLDGQATTGWSRWP